MRNAVFLAYTDESGDSGFVNSPTNFFVVSCVVVHDSVWQESLDYLVAWRRHLKAQHGILVRPELKSEDFVYGRGPLSKMAMSRKARMKLMAQSLTFAGQAMNIRVFAVAIDKGAILSRTINDPREVAWRYVIQRLDTMCRKSQTPERVMLLPDEGHGKLVRSVIRKGRKIQSVGGYFGGRLDIKTQYIIEDPSDKKSHDSYFTQLADWCAYAAHRSHYVAPVKRARLDLWDQLGSVRHLEVNDLRGGPPAIVVWP